jgi:predicted anti-sigma-YlaC factor YlaD
MNCELSKEYIMKYFDGERNDIEDVQFKQHLKSCSSCNDEFNCMEEIFKAIETQTEVEPPADFEAMVMEKVGVIEKQRSEAYSKRIVLLYNAATVISIILLLVFVADLKQVSVFNAFEKISEYFSSFSSATSAVFGVVSDIFRLIGGALFVVLDVAFSIFKSYYYVFLALVVMLFAIQKLLNYVGTQSREEVR